MEFGLNFEKLLLIGLIAVVIIGPERLPKAAETFARFVRRAGEYVRSTKSRMRDELGPEMNDVDWRKLDPRQYDPRRIIRDALLDDSPSAATAVTSPIIDAVVPAAAASITPDGTSTARGRRDFTRDTPPPFDLEAT